MILIAPTSETICRNIEKECINFKNPLFPYSFYALFSRNFHIYYCSQSVILHHRIGRNGYHFNYQAWTNLFGIVNSRSLDNRIEQSEVNVAGLSEGDNRCSSAQNRKGKKARDIIWHSLFANIYRVSIMFRMGILVTTTFLDCFLERLGYRSFCQCLRFNSFRLAGNLHYHTPIHNYSRYRWQQGI